MFGPALAAGLACGAAFPSAAVYVRQLWPSAVSAGLLGYDPAQYLQNFLTVIGLLFSLLVGNTFVFLYSQQEGVYYALFREVSVAKALTEQLSLVGRARPAELRALMGCVRAYVETDLRRLDVPPATLVSAKPAVDPLESILYRTSVGAPGQVYETVKSLRAARGERLGALQRKLPPLHLGMLALLGALELGAFCARRARRASRA